MTFDVAPKSAIPKDLSFTVTECTVEDNQSGLSYPIVQNSCPNSLVNMAFDQFSSNESIEMTYTAFQFVQLANQETQQTLKCSVSEKYKKKHSYFTQFSLFTLNVFRFCTDLVKEFL